MKGGDGRKRVRVGLLLKKGYVRESYGGLGVGGRVDVLQNDV